LVQPITRAVHDLTPILAARTRLTYPGAVRHLVVCDRADTASQTLCRAVLGPGATIVLAAPDGGAIATKVAKLRAALPALDGEIACFVDDDITLPPDALQVLVAPLLRAEVGATFGLARYTAWESAPSSLMSLFVNSNALLSYLPLTYLTESFTITGHLFALRRATLAAVGAFGDEPTRIDDDHELARRVRAARLRIVQTALIYDVTNRLDSFAAYRAQLRRWFIFPRQAMLPYLDQRDRALTGLGSVGGLLPPLLLLLAILTRRRVVGLAYLLALALATAIQARLESAYLGRATPPRRWALFPLVVTVTPVHVLALLFARPVVEWRGQRLYIERGGLFRVLGAVRSR
jgi:ceramide glucosyltransferase